MQPVQVRTDHNKLLRSAAAGSCFGLPKRSARGITGASTALVRESALANSVTSCPCWTSSSVNQCTTRSVPPYSLGGTLSASGAIWAIRIFRQDLFHLSKLRFFKRPLALANSSPQQGADRVPEEPAPTGDRPLCRLTRALSAGRQQGQATQTQGRPSCSPKGTIYGGCCCYFFQSAPSAKPMSEATARVTIGCSFMEFLT